MIERCLKVFLAAAVIALAVPATGQERPEDCLIEIWPDFFSPGPQQHQLREKLVTDAGEIYAIEFGPLAGEYAKLYLFFLDHGGCERKALIVGSFNYITEIARENGEIGPARASNPPACRRLPAFRASPRPASTPTSRPGRPSCWR